MRENEKLEAISLQEAIAGLPVYGIISLNLQGIVQSWNRGATDLLGYTEEEAVGRHFEFIFVEEDRARNVPKAEMESALSQICEYDDRWHLRKDQSRIYVNGGLCFVKNAQGEALGFIKIVRDQTEKKERIEQIQNLNLKLKEAHETLHHYAGELEERVAARTRQLNERNSELEAFCYSISHDIRAPLRSIQAMSQIVIEDYGASFDPTCREYLERIARAGQRLDQLTLDLLKYSRLSREEVELEPVSVAAAIEEVIASLQAIIVKREAEVLVQPPFPEVKAQHSYLVQILSNFLSNALKFTSPGMKPRVEIWAESNPERTRIFVKDNGIGIPAEYRERIFQLFERLHPERSFEGTGVGLAIAHKAALRLNGAVGLTQNAETGMTFWVDLGRAK